MRPEGKSKLESLYFKYPKFDFDRPPEMDGRSSGHGVVIGGAGPIGMTAALELARRGVACILLDSKDTLNDGSRAICVSRSSFETLQQLGVVDRFEEKALGWTHGRCYYRDQMIYRLEMPHSAQERFLPMYNIQQQYIEQFLLDKIAEYPGLIDMRWQSKVVGVRNNDNDVELSVETPEGEYLLRADFLLAADGARSQIRGMLDLRLKGNNLPGNYVIADIQMDHDFPTERRSFFESKANPESTILIHRQPDSIWRVDWQLPPDEDPDEAIAEANIRTRAKSILNMIGYHGSWELEWWSIYTANTLCLDEYRHGRTLFIGDSAHIVPIFGVRGLNNGIADAVNAAWKLAYVLSGEASDTILDSYTPERRGATLDVFENAGKSSRFMTPPSRGYALMRKAALQLALTQDFAKRFADPRQVLPYTYANSPLTSHQAEDSEFVGGVSAGDAAINRKLSKGGFLLAHLGLGFTGLYFIEQDRVPDETADLIRAAKKLNASFVLIIVSRKPIQHSEAITLEDVDGSIFDGYAAVNDTFYLIRPDRHVAARWMTFDASKVMGALSTTLSMREL